MKVEIIRPSSRKGSLPDFKTTADHEYVIGGVGPQGPRGYSPVRGLDYWTEEDVAFIQRTAIDAVLEVYPAAERVEW